jgi:hypothetical protein
MSVAARAFLLILLKPVDHQSLPSADSSEAITLRLAARSCSIRGLSYRIVSQNVQHTSASGRESSGFLQKISIASPSFEPLQGLHLAHH